VVETGAHSTEAFDYPLAADAVACELKSDTFDFGILVCGTGIGVCIRANRYSHIRAAECTSEEMARLARQHNHANVLCLGGRILDKEQSIAILSAFLETSPDAAERHARRVNLLDAKLSC
jgi:ribose 5-phosphate isomerase B